jgi:hypothetical protein
MARGGNLQRRNLQRRNVQRRSAFCHGEQGGAAAAQPSQRAWLQCGPNQKQQGKERLVWFWPLKEFLA